MIRRPPRSTQSRSSAASDVYKRQLLGLTVSWWVLGVGVFPLFTGLAWLYVRLSNDFEDEAIGMVDVATLPGHRRGHRLPGPVRDAPVPYDERLLRGQPGCQPAVELLGDLGRVPVGRLVHGHRGPGHEVRLRRAVVRGRL